MNKAIEILTRVGAIIPQGHFVGTSGLHFDTYINKDFLYPHTEETSRIGLLFAEKYKDKNIDIIVGPALGGIILSQWVAYHLSRIYKKEVLGIYTEKTSDGQQIFTRGYEDHIKGKRILIVEDSVTTGGSIMKVIQAVQEAGGNIVSTCAMINRNPNLGNSLLGVEFQALGSLYVPSFSADSCPLCKSGVAINTKIGHGNKYLKSMK